MSRGTPAYMSGGACVCAPIGKPAVTSCRSFLPIAGGGRQTETEHAIAVGGLFDTYFAHRRSNRATASWPSRSRHVSIARSHRRTLLSERGGQLAQPLRQELNRVPTKPGRMG